VIDRSDLEADVKSVSRTIFDRIAMVEAGIHGTPMEEVHFHELGGLDSVIDICGAVWAFGRSVLIKSMSPG